MEEHERSAGQYLCRKQWRIRDTAIIQWSDCKIERQAAYQLHGCFISAEEVLMSRDMSLAMDPSTMYFTGMAGMNGLPGSMSASQNGMNGHDTSMTGMLEDGMLGDEFDGMPLSLESGLDGTGQKPYSPIPQNGDDRLEDSGNGSSNQMDIPMSGAGAGPLPTGFGTQSTIGGGSTLTEFTKRRNWSQRVVEELKDFLHILTPDGRLVYVSPSSSTLTGFPHEELVGKFIVDFIHPDDSGIFVREFNESIATGNPLRFFYRFRKKDGSYTIFESHGHPHLTSEAAAFGPNNAAGFCRGFFMMARPYPTKNAALLDSFLEHKIENERLTKRINDLKKEEAEEAEEATRHWMKKQEGRSEVATEDTECSTTNTASIAPDITNPDVLAMPPPAKPSAMNAALTRQNLEDANATSKPDSINDKMARYEGATHIETIEMLTGLRYQDGERSQGISTGDMSPALIRGDAGIAIPIDKESRASDKKKKTKLPDEYVCTDCGTLDSPEWRKGPSGPKTLCNACGLRWAKKEKKKTGPGTALTPVGSGMGSS
ncbi:GATA zinc finger [Phlyctema vagabunda]|uniref:GATA zinc finger n=1 Tax=Phlyctema vagabunda TaxID=108571 RepID=A0ABR4PJE8_9HELO